MNKTIIELREEAIKEDKNPEFYLYQKLEEKDKEIERLNNIINQLDKWLKNEHENGYEVYYIMAIQDVLDKLKELKEEIILKEES